MPPRLEFHSDVFLFSVNQISLRGKKNQFFLMFLEKKYNLKKTKQIHNLIKIQIGSEQLVP